MGLGFSCPKEDGSGLSTAGRSRQQQEMSPCPGGGIIGLSRFRPSGKLRISREGICPDRHRQQARQQVRSVCSCAGGGGILGLQAGENSKTVSQCPIAWLQKHRTCGFWHCNWRLDFSPFSHLRPISNCRNLQHNISNYQVPWQRLSGMAWHEVMAIFC
jgi:hypothetical protein